MKRVLARNKRAWMAGTLITREYALHARFREFGFFKKRINKNISHSGEATP